MEAMDAAEPLPDLGRLLMLNENIGGHATMHLHLYRALRTMPDVDFVALDVPPRSFSRRLAGVQVPGLSRLDADLASIRAQLALSSTAQRMLDAAISQGPVGAVHAYSQHVALRSVAALRSYPSVVSTDATTAQNALQLPYRTPARFTPFSTRVAEYFEAKVFGAATMVVAQSEWAAGAIRDRYGTADDDIRVIPFGMMPPEPAEPVTVDGPPEITFTGTSLSRKGGDTLLRAFRDRLHDRCVLNLVTPEYVTPEPGLRVHRAIRPGDRRLVELLARTSVFVLPSAIDKSPYSILEAMFAGVPVVSTTVGGIPELVVDGETGILVPPDDPPALADAIERLLGDDALRARMGEAGRTRAVARFDARVTTRQLLQVIAEAEARFHA
jgi:alpha-maltose-1-phosphate synthase